MNWAGRAESKERLPGEQTKEARGIKVRKKYYTSARACSASPLQCNALQCSACSRRMAEATDASVRCSWEDAGAGVGRDAPPLSDAFKSTASTLKNRHNMSHVSHVFYIKCFKCPLLLQILSHNQTECSISLSQHLYRWRALKKGVPSIDFARWTVSDKFWVRQGGGHFSGRRWHS